MAAMVTTTSSSAGIMPLAALAVVAAACWWAAARRARLRSFHAIPSPPGALPFVGHILQWLLHGPAQAHELYLRWHEAHGGIVRVRLLHRDIVLVADPAAAAQVLAAGPNECARRTPEYALFDAAHGMGCHAIMTEQDEGRWKAVRRTIAPAYGPAAIREAFPSIVKCYAQLCSRIAGGDALRRQPPPVRLGGAAGTAADTAAGTAAETAAAADVTAAAVCIDEEIFAATVAIMAEGMLKMDLQGSSSLAGGGAAAAAGACAAAANGSSLAGGGAGAAADAAAATSSISLQQLASDVASLVAITNTFLAQPWKKWAYLACPRLCQESRTFHAQRRSVMALTGAMAAHVQAFREQVLPRAPDDPSLVACLARLREPGSGRFFSTQALQAELFLETVGQEAIPWTAAWTLYLLTQHPDAERRMLAELAAAGVPCNGDVAAAAAALRLELVSSRAALPFCTAVLKEAMRMYPAGVAATPRMCHQPTRVGRYEVPAGIIVFPCLYTILMSSANWEAPHEFRPERWLAEPAGAQGAAASPDSSSSSGAFIPFSIGPKACVAQQLAYVQLKVVLALLVSCFSWRLAPCMGGPQGVKQQCVAALELRVAQGMWLLPRQRAV